MEYTSYYPNPQNFGLVYPTAGQHPNEHAGQTYSSISPPPYGSYDVTYNQYNAIATNGSSNGALSHEIDSTGIDADGDLHQIRQSSSEEKDSMPQHPVIQRRKVQNRAAQRAFRERKEKHVKELEQRLSNLEESSSSVQAENERLKHELQKVSTENEILRATTANNKYQSGSENNKDIHVGPTSFPPSINTPRDFFNTLLEKHKDQTPNHRVVRSATTGERLLGAGAVWEMIITDPLFQDSLVDITMVCDRLKGMAQCDGFGPVFEEKDVRNVIQESSVEDRDELI